jgi:hypothetical protein
MLHRRPRGHFTPILPTNTVREREKPTPMTRLVGLTRFHEPEVILVVAAYLPRVRKLGELNVQH